MNVIKIYIKNEDEKEELRVKPQDRLLADHVEQADTFFSRLLGLLGREALPEGHGLLLSPCAAIHCGGMKFPIDAIFLDGEFKVLRVAQHLARGERAAQKGAKHVLELPAGRAESFGLIAGQRLIIRL